VEQGRAGCTTEGVVDPRDTRVRTGDTAQVTTIAAPLDPPRSVTAVRAVRFVPAIATVCVLLLVAGLGSYPVRGAPIQQFFDAWALHQAPLGLVCVTVFGVALRRHPANVAAWLFFVAGVISSVQVVAMAAVYTTSTRQPSLWQAMLSGTVTHRELPAVVAFPLWLAVSSWLLAAGLAIVGLLHFPDGQLPSARWRPVRWILVTGLMIAVFAWMWASRPWSPHLLTLNELNPDDRVAWILFVVGMPMLGLGVLLTVASLVARMRATDPDDRRRVRPVVIAASLLLTTLVVLYPWQAIWAVATVPAVMLLLGVIAGSVTRHRMFDVEFVVSRAVTVAMLGGVVTLVYVGMVAGIGALLGNGSRLWLSVAATAVIAVAFEPLRRRTLLLATRLVTGTRATPEEALAALSDQLARADSTTQVLDRVVELLVSSTGASRAEIRIRRDDGVDRLEASTGVSTDTARRVTPIVHEGQTMGEVRLLADRDDRFLPADERLLRQVAAALGPVARNVRLTGELHAHIDELRSSRQRIVTAHDDARRTLERDIHDGAQQQLLALRLTIGLASTLAERDGAAATSETLARAAQQAEDAIRRLRDLARGLYPPVLAEQGLVAALRAHARDVPLQVTVEAEGFRRHDRSVEAAVYLCCLEAMHNASRHAHATTLRVELSDGHGTLTFAVVDDGNGFDPANAEGGAGLTNMRDRVEALGGRLEIMATPGGGAAVRGWVPEADAEPIREDQSLVSDR
jgi:two-component system, NarL family, sensor kinase